MPTLTPRQENLLQFIVGEYVTTAAPVSSETLVRRAGLRLSSATVRNEMAALEDAGLISRPHISAGGVPSDEAYRYCVQLLLEPPPLPLDLQRALRVRMGKVAWDPEAWTGVAVQVLSDLAKNLAVVTMPRAQESRVRHLALVYLEELLVLLVVVLREARVHKELVHLQEPVNPEDLGSMANRLNAYFGGSSRREIQSKQVELASVESQLRSEVLHALEVEDRAMASDYFTEGLRHLLAQPEFDTVPRARVLVEALEERRLVQAVLREAPEAGALRVVIGHENHDDALKPMSVVVAQYGATGAMTGTLAVLGPTRMEYPWAMAGVQYLSTLLGELLEGVQGSRLTG